MRLVTAAIGAVLSTAALAQPTPKKPPAGGGVQVVVKCLPA
jgi:hypothetical protein